MILRKREVFRLPEHHTSSLSSSPGGCLWESLILCWVNLGKNCQMNVQGREVLINKVFLKISV
jgi:hypothetical protein